MHNQAASNNESQNNDNLEEQVSYSKETFNIKKQMGEVFVPNFIKKNKLQDLKELVGSAVNLSKEKNGRSVVISVCSEKGGVGKTTTAIALAQLLVNLEFRVLVLDTDNLKSSAKILNSRIKAIHELIQEGQDENTPEEIIINRKKNLDPIVDTLPVDVKAFNTSYIEDLASSNQYDIIVVDTAGRKDSQAGTFDPRKLEAADVPHITSAYNSNAIIIPMKTTSIDMLVATEYYLPLLQFFQAIKSKKVVKYQTVARILPSMIEKDGLGVRELVNFKEETGFDFFDTEIRRSEKIANKVNYLGIETVFTTKVAGGVLQSFFKLAEQVFEDVKVSLGE